ncbi:hypothetical protein ACTXT7_016307, partial [Hymenolepis weldensis]
MTLIYLNSVVNYSPYEYDFSEPFKSKGAADIGSMKIQCVIPLTATDKQNTCTR